MIYITADTHGDIDNIISKSTKHLKKTDTLIILGDFGFFWSGDELEKKALKKLSKAKFKILFLDGLIDNMDLIKSYPEATYQNAKAIEIVPDKIYFIHRGEILIQDDMKILCFGGADNQDLDIEVSSEPNIDDFNTCVENLKTYNFEIDYILTHSPAGITNNLLTKETPAVGYVFKFLDLVYEKATYKKWYFGYCHQDKYVSPKMQSVYTNIYPIEK